MGIADTLYAALGGTATMRIEAFDGSSAGPTDAPTGLTLKSPLARQHLITGRGALGLSRAFVVGELELKGDAYTTLKAVTENSTNLSVQARLGVLREAVRFGGLGILRPPPAPPE